MISRRLLILSSAALALTSLAGCEKAAHMINPPDLNVDRAYVALAANPDAPSALYFTVHGGPSDTKLLNVLIDSALRYEMHESVKSGDMTEMKPLEYAVIPAGKEIAFKPGGKHVMVWGISEKAIAANKMAVVFVFQNGDRIVYDAQFVQPGEAPPAMTGNEAG